MRGPSSRTACHGTCDPRASGTDYRRGHLTEQAVFDQDTFTATKNGAGNFDVARDPYAFALIVSRP